VRPERHLFISPHYDDIALSIGGTAKLISNTGRKPEIALVFGDYPDPAQPLSKFAADLHEEWGFDAASVVASRRAEEAVASEVLGTTDRFLPFRDAIYRGHNYTNNDLLFGLPAIAEADLPVQIVESLQLDPADKAITRIYSPLAVGLHVDHQQAFLAGKLLADHGWDVWFYEDLPYSIWPGARDARLAALGLTGKAPAAVVDVSSAWIDKIHAILAYPSQMVTVFGYVGRGATSVEVDATMREYALAAGSGILAERFWSLGR
jgi:LmbE family N-acetylglucosaminyl deacetylase